MEPPAGAAIGERVFVEGYPGEPDEVLNPKKKVWETVSHPKGTCERVCGVKLCYGPSPTRCATSRRRSGRR